MDESAISVRYAKAVFNLGKEQDMLSLLKNDMEVISAACKQSVEFNQLLSSPVIPASKKVKLLRQIFSQSVTAVTMNLLELLSKNKRETFLESICRNVLAMIRKEKNIKTAVVTTARELDQENIGQIIKILEKELGASVELTERVNQKIIGGLILSIDDKQYDASVATRIKKIRQKLIQTSL
jgi:F-type H+-transporting ATPase subunit delta